MKSKLRGLFLGRFQPYHKGHQSVIEQIVKEVDELIIAVGSAQWSHSLENPFTAGERVMMISRVLRAMNLDIVTYILPIEDIERNALYVSHICEMTPPFEAVYSNNPLVIQLFKEAGFEVRCPPMVQRNEYWGTHIRKLMLCGDEWRKLVPKPVCEVIDEIGGVERLKRLAKTDKHRPLVE